jgi:hypothetical protein
MEEQYFKNKKEERTYISKQLKSFHLKESDKRPVRIISRVKDSVNTYLFTKVEDEIVIRITSSEREELVAKFFEDTGGIFILTFQKFHPKTGNPHSCSFSFINEEIQIIYDFITRLGDIPLRKKEKVRFENTLLSEIFTHRNDLVKFINTNEETISEVLKNDVSKNDIIAIGYRKRQLETFKKLLTDPDYFQNAKDRKETASDERLWQLFFEKNPWIFGYGLSYIFLTNLEDKKLEQVVSGYNFNQEGKRIDALLKSKGAISALCFVEIKTHKTMLLSREYRKGVWNISEELNGGVSQLRHSVSVAQEAILRKNEIIDENGFPTGEILFNYSPKSFIVIGTLEEFRNQHGVNEKMYSSFQTYRNNQNGLEIITYDELYERAKFIVENEY